MLMKNTLGLVLAGSFTLIGGTALVLQGTANPQEAQEKTLKKVPISQSKPDSGKRMYADYCAACHGMDGKGNGPAVEFLKAQPSDLTTMAKRNDGKFPEQQFASVLRLGTSSHPHGTSDMPIWGPLFRSQNKDVVELRIHNLTLYVESMQQR